MLAAFHEKLTELLAGGAPFVVVTLVDTVGSVPQVAGARMIVDGSGLVYGTVGGGKIERRAITEAQKLLEVKGSSDGRTAFYSWSLNGDIGMTCGGSVRLFMEAYNLGLWNICIFGAGHCASALIEILSRLDCSVTCIDTRSDWLDRLPAVGRLKKVLVADYSDGLAHVYSLEKPFVLLLTMGHATDSPVLLKLLAEIDQGRALPYIGVIGSKAKAAGLNKDLRSAGLEHLSERFFCPVGLSLGNNDPHEIAVSISAQLLQERDKMPG